MPVAWAWPSDWPYIKMIEINLAPGKNRRKAQGQQSALAAFHFPKEAVVGFIGGFLVLLFAIHFLLQMAIFIKFAQHKRERRQWERIVPEKAQADVVLNEMRGLQSKLSSIDKLKSEKRIIWSQKLSDISNTIPRGVWLNKISLKDSVLFIDGSAVSKMRDEMALAGNFVTSLRGVSTFMDGLQSIELGSIQRRQMKAVDVVDFIITARLK